MIRLQYTEAHPRIAIPQYVPPYGTVIVYPNWVFFTELIGKQVLSAYKDNLGYTEIIQVSDITLNPTGKHVYFYPDSGLIKVPTWMEVGETLVVLYQDITNACLTPIIQTNFHLPNGNASIAYNASFYIAGTKPFTLSSIVKPAWMTITLSGSSVSFTGTPSISDAGSSIPVSFTIANTCGNTNFSQVINVTVLPANFGKVLYAGGDFRTQYKERVFLTGTPGVTATVTLDSITNTNGGAIIVNSVTASVGSTYNVTFDSTGTNYLFLEVNGVTNPGTQIIAHFTITAVSAGTIGTNNTYQFMKKF